MTQTKTPSVEDRLELLEQRLGRVESKFMQVPGLPDHVRLVEGPSGVYAVVFFGSAPFDLALVTRAQETLVRQEPPVQRETPVEPWKHLVARKHPWRRQLSIKGRNMTVRQLVSGIKANKFSDDQAAENYDLPVEAIREALAYAEENAALLDLETAYERYRLEQRGKRRGPESVPG